VVVVLVAATVPAICLIETRFVDAFFVVDAAAVCIAVVATVVSSFAVVVLVTCLNKPRFVVEDVANFEDVVTSLVAVFWYGNAEPGMLVGEIFFDWGANKHGALAPGPHCLV
jgi:hypothetical protein